MPALGQNFTIPQGTGSQVNFVVNPPVGDTLLGSQIFWSIFPMIQDIPQQPAVVSKMLDNGIEVDDPIAQTFHATLVQSDTENLTPGNYYHEVVILDPTGGDLTVTTEGVMTLIARVWLPLITYPAAPSLYDDSVNDTFYSPVITQM